MLRHPYSIELAALGDVPKLAAIEQAAGRLFEAYFSLDEFEDNTGEDELLTALARGLLWVARCYRQPVGFALAEPIGSDLHLEEIDVHPDHGRRGLGAALVRTVCAAAADRGCAAVTLTTFRDVPWNMPFYAGLGFEVISPDSLSPDLRAIVLDEASRGLDPETRVVMRFRLPAHPHR